MYDLLSPSTWVPSMLRGVQLTLASARFTAKNARFFAGYARDATHVPLSWTPPARVVFSIDVACWAILEAGRVVERSGPWGSTVEGLHAFRRPPGKAAPVQLPEEVAGLLDEPIDAVVGLPHREGPVVLPAHAVRATDAVSARVARTALQLADARSSSNAALVADHASAWRAAKMRGVMYRGPGSVYLPSELWSGSKALAEEVGGLEDDDAVVRIRPRSAVWWSGWASATVAAS
jgi:hypothetical protein